LKSFQKNRQPTFGISVGGKVPFAAMETVIMVFRVFRMVLKNLPGKNRATVCPKIVQSMGKTGSKTLKGTKNAMVPGGPY
jgi:hypothetical protein